ncbi:MAG: Uma2 family endonuclease [Nannocystaceae bacterium]
MSVGLPSATMSASEYLAWERLQLERHEYLRGEVFAMAGGSPRHNALSAAVIRDLGLAVRGSDCRVLTSDQRIVVWPGEHYVYADASLVCGAFELAEGTSDVLANPRIVFEVLSKSTEAYDRGDKWAAYRRLPSLVEYVLVSQAVSRVEHFHREQAGWHFEVVEAGGRLALTGGFELEVDALYDGVMALPGE